MRRAVCPGSFDPLTNGHMDVVGRAAALFDEVVVLVAINPAKQGLFSVDERIAMIDEVAKPLGNVRADAFQGLLVDYCRDAGVNAIVKGLRGLTDFEYELPMAQMNRRLIGIETLFMAGDPRASFVASSLVKEVAKLGGDVADLLPPSVHTRLMKRIAESS
jgi:pantetheine-phosphate adenylyltransferase